MAQAMAVTVWPRPVLRGPLRAAAVPPSPWPRLPLRGRAPALSRRRAAAPRCSAERGEGAGGEDLGNESQPPSPAAPPSPSPSVSSSSSVSSEESSSGGSSPQPPEERVVPLPRDVVQTLRDQVFGFDSFFVTDQEPYQGGVLFKGNLRGSPALAYEKIDRRLKARFGEKYALYLLDSPTEDPPRPVAVVIPTEEVVPPLPSVSDSLAAPAFGLVTLLTVLLTNSPSPDFGFVPSVEYLLGPLVSGIPAASVFVLGLLAHEAGHLLVARSLGIDLAPPYFIPSYQLGSFGAITRIKSVVRNRSDLVELAAAGPLLGGAVSLAVVGFSLLLLHPDPSQGPAVVLEAAAFQDSFLVGGLAKLILGENLKQGVELAISPITLAAWSCLLANAINAIPAGEIDGGRVALGLFGRQWATRGLFVTLILLGFTGIFNDVALFWVVLISFLQRGPIAPLSDELSPPSSKAKTLGSAALIFCFLVYCPFPFEL